MKALLALLLALAACAVTLAHTRSQTNGVLSANEQGVRLTLSIEARELTRLTALPGLAIPLDQAMRRHFVEAVRVSADGAPCTATAQTPVFAAVMRVEIAYACPPKWRSLSLNYDALFDVVRGHIAIVHTEIDGAPRGEAVLSKLSRTMTIPREAGAAPSQPAGFPTFLRMGIEHILDGVDHLSFVIGLLLLSNGFRPAIAALTGFTLGHSATLALGAMDVVRVAPATVEALIAATILCAGLEAVKAQGAPRAAVMLAALTAAGFVAAMPVLWGSAWLPALACAALILGAGFGHAVWDWRKGFLFAAGFGLVHGLAFAETLREALTPGGGLIAALFGFNLGVETGQIAVAAVAAGLFALWRTRFPSSAAAGAYATACLLLFGGGVWLAARLPLA